MTESIRIRIAPTVPEEDEGHLLLHIDRPSGTERGRCLIVPPYGVPAAALGFVAEALVARGRTAIRLDPRDHAGRGSGEMIDFRMSSLAADVATAIELVEPTCVTALSMGARATLRALRTTGTAADAVLLIPVVDARATIRTIVGFDWFAVPDAELPPSAPVLGLDIRASRFLRDSERHALTELEDTRVDVAASRGRLTLVPGTADPWVDARDVAALRRIDPARITVRPVESDRHRFDEDPVLLRRFVDLLVERVDELHRPHACP